MRNFFYFFNIKYLNFSFFLLLNTITFLKPSLHFSLFCHFICTLLHVLLCSTFLQTLSFIPRIIWVWKNLCWVAYPFHPSCVMLLLLICLVQNHLWQMSSYFTLNTSGDSDSLTSCGSLFHCLSVFIVSKFLIIFNLHFPCNSSNILLCLWWLMRIISLVPLHICRELSRFS